MSPTAPAERRGSYTSVWPLRSFLPRGAPAAHPDDTEHAIGMLGLAGRCRLWLVEGGQPDEGAGHHGPAEVQVMPAGSVGLGSSLVGDPESVRLMLGELTLVGVQRGRRAVFVNGMKNTPEDLARAEAILLREGR